MSSKTNRGIGLTFSLKLSILYAVFFVVSSLALFLVAYYKIDRWVGEKEREVIRDRIQEYTAWYYEGGVDAVRTRFALQSRSSGDIFFIRIIGPLDQVLFISLPPGVEDADLRRLKNPDPGRKDPLFFVEDDGKGSWTIGNSRLPGGLILQVGKNSTRSQEFLSYLSIRFPQICTSIAPARHCRRWLSDLPRHAPRPAVDPDGAQNSRDRRHEQPGARAVRTRRTR